MLKRTFILVLLAAMLLSATAVAEVTNRDMQLLGGVVVSNANDSFFFCPMEEGMTKHWGLYALSSAGDKPIVEIEDGYPARLVHATSDKVYFLGYTDGARSVHALYSVEISSGKYSELLTGIKEAYVAESDEFFYITETDPYTLHSYNVTNEKSKEIKDMSKSEKMIYDAGKFDGETYFITKTASGALDGYLYHDSSGKATNLDKPSPSVVNGMLYEGYRLYSSDSSNTQVYSLKLGAKKSVRLGQTYNMNLSNPRFGQYMYAYDGDKNQLVALPLDGSDALTLTLEGSTLVRFLLGGSKDELFLPLDDAIYSVRPDLSSMTRLFDFDQRTGGQVWSYIAPGANNAIFVMGYGQETFTNSNNMLPTGVYAYDRNSGEMLFGFPEWDPNAEPEETGGEAPASTVPSTFGDVPEEEREEGETYFVFSGG